MTAKMFTQLRGKEKEYKRRNVQPLLVLAQQAFQLKRPKTVDKHWEWPEKIPAEVLFDPLATVSATYGVAFQTQFRQGDAPWSSRPAIFVIDRNGVLRHMYSRNPNQDIREEEISSVLDDLEEQHRLITALVGKDEERREAAGAALAPPGPRTATAIPALIKSLKDEDAQVRAGAAAALLWLAPRAERAIPALTVALKDEDSRVRRFAATTLGRFGAGAKAAVPTLIQRLKDEDARVRAEAVLALECIGPAAGVGLQQALKDTDPRLRTAAAQILPRFPAQAESTIPLFLEALRDDDAGLRLAVLNALRRLPVPPEAKKPAVPALTRALKDKDAQVRTEAAYVLGQLGTIAKDAVPALTEALNDENPQVRQAATRVLKEIDREAAKKAGRLK